MTLGCAERGCPVGGEPLLLKPHSLNNFCGGVAVTHITAECDLRRTTPPRPSDATPLGSTKPSAPGHAQEPLCASAAAPAEAFRSPGDMVPGGGRTIVLIDLPVSLWHNGPTT